MAVIKFYNRQKELTLLKRVRKPFFCIIYGRRRIGKTALVLHYLRGKDFLYFFVNPKKPEAMLLEEYSALLREKLSLPAYLRPKTWDEFFKMLFENYRGFVVFDEFQWFAAINKEVPFILQKYWDLYKNTSIIITGSIIGMIKELFTKEGSPLFKRADITINLRELPVATVFKMLEDAKINALEEKFKFYLLFGGTPYYYHLIFKYAVQNLDEAINVLVLDENAPLRREVEDIMIEAFKKDYRSHLSIMYALAEGRTKLSEIAGFAGIKTTSIMPYLYDLMDLLNLVEKQRVGVKKKHIYLIKDNFHNFWLKYVYRYSDILEKGTLYKKIKADINSFFGQAFENFIRDSAKQFFPEFTKFMKYIGYYREHGHRKTFDIDILALNEKTKEILFAECKWQNRVNPEKICKELAEKASCIQWNNKKRKESYAVFAKSFSKRIKSFEENPVYCFDLKDIMRTFQEKPPFP